MYLFITLSLGRSNIIFYLIFLFGGYCGESSMAQPWQMAQYLLQLLQEFDPIQWSFLAVKLFVASHNLICLSSCVIV